MASLINLHQAQQQQHRLCSHSSHSSRRSSSGSNPSNSGTIAHLRCMHACTQRLQPVVGTACSQLPAAAWRQTGSRPMVAAAAGPQTKPSGMQGQVDPDYLAAASYLAEVGFTNKTEIARVLDIAMNPNSLFVQASANANARPLSVEKDIVPVVEFLRSRGVGSADVVKVLSAHPPVLSYSVEGRLVPFFEYLSSIGVTDVAAAVAKRPSLLGLSVDTSLRKIVEYLQYIETPPEKIVDYICNSI